MKKIFPVCLISILWIFIFSGVASSQAMADISRPEKDKGPTRVEIGIVVMDVDTIDTVNQSFEANLFVEIHWKDPRMAHSDSRKIGKSLYDVWNPQMMFTNDQRTWHSFPEMVYIQQDGSVTYRQHLWGSFSQPLDLKAFPFDSQSFEISMASARYSDKELEVVPLAGAGIARKLSIPDWNLIQWKAAPKTYEPVEGEPGVAGFSFLFEMKRIPGHFILKIILPLLLIVAMSWTVFWIDPSESGTNVSVSITAMLTLIAYRFSIGEDIPNVSYLTGMDYFIMGSTLLVFISLVQVVVTKSYVNQGHLEQALKIDRWCRVIYPALYFVVALESLLFRFLF